MDLYSKFKHALASASGVHLPGKKPNAFVFSMPRSGSTWLMELVLTQPGFKPCNEPCNLWDPHVREHLGRLGITDWKDFHASHAGRALENYFRGFCDGRLKFKNPFLHRNHFRLVTNRIVFKIIHCGEERINWFRDTFNGRIALLVRHPIPVSLSREFYPRLEARLATSYRENFSRSQIGAAKRIAASGTKLEQGVLDWCLQTAVALKTASPDWAIVSYEQLVMDPKPVIGFLAEKLDLPEPARMIGRLTTPSASTHKSDEQSREALKKNAGRNRWLVEKWRERVGEEQERRAMDILKVFDLDFYQFGSSMPVDRYWIQAGLAGMRQPENVLEEQARA